MIKIVPTTTRGELLDQLRAAHDADITTAYIWTRHPHPLAAIDLVAHVVEDASSW